MIYFDSETKTKIILNLQDALEPHGALVVGASENILGIDGCRLSGVKGELESTSPGVFVFND